MEQTRDDIPVRVSDTDKAQYSTFATFPFSPAEQNIESGNCGYSSCAMFNAVNVDVKITKEIENVCPLEDRHVWPYNYFNYSRFQKDFIHLLCQRLLIAHYHNKKQ